MRTKFMNFMMVALLLGGSITLSAQNKETQEKKQRPTPEQMTQMQTDRMVKALMLDDATATKFTSVYGNYLKELRECRMMNRTPRAQKDATQATKDAPRAALTDAEIAKQIKDQFAQSRKLLDVREKYYAEFSKVLSQKQVMRIYQMEKSNANKFKKEFDRRKKGQKPGQGDRQRQRQHAPHHIGK